METRDDLYHQEEMETRDDLYHQEEMETGDYFFDQEELKTRRVSSINQEEAKTVK